MVSISHYTNRVNQLTADVAGLRGKLADERKKLADANAKALKAVEALNKATSASQLSSKARDVERHQKAAASHEKKAADLEKKIAEKQKALTSAQDSLSRAQRDQQRKDDRETEKRRKADIEHIKALERARRGSIPLPEHIQPRTIVRAPNRRLDPILNETFDVCLSFAGEQRDYVERIAVTLKEVGLRVFYDQDEDIAAMLWGRDLGEVLDYVYREGSRLCVMFVSADYAAKAWTRHERRSALARAIEQDEYVLPARFDDTTLPGLRPTIGYLDLREVAPATLVDFVRKKLATAASESPDALDAILDAAPLDDEPTTAEEDAGVEEARTEFERGEVFDADQIKRELG